MMSCRKGKLFTLVPKVQWKTPLTDPRYPTHFFILIVLTLIVKPHLWVLSSRSRRKQSWVVVTKPCSVNVFGVIDITAPVYFLDLLAAAIAPHLDLVLGGVAAGKDLAVLEVEGVAWDVGP